MFHFFREKPIVNRIFGTVKLYAGRWSTSVDFRILLWNKEYKLDISVVDDAGNGINQMQEDVFVRFKHSLEKHQAEIEHLVSAYFRTSDEPTLISKFVPYQLLLNTNGECVVVAENKDDEDTHDVLPGLAVVIYPKLSIFTEEAYARYAFFDTEDGVKKCTVWSRLNYVRP